MMRWLMIFAVSLCFLAAPVFAQDEADTPDPADTEVSNEEIEAEEAAPAEFGIETIGVEVLEAGAPVTVTLNLADSGYVRIFSPDEAGLKLSSAVIFSGDGTRLGEGVARVPIPDGAYAEVTFPEPAGTVPLSIERLEDMDFREPNNDELLAWPLDLGERGDVILYPGTDRDMFRFTLEREAFVNVDLDSPDLPIRIRYIEPETGRIEAVAPFADLPAGDHLIEFSWTNAGILDPDPIKFLFEVRPPLAQQAAFPSEDAVPLGHPIILPAQADHVLKLEIERPGLYVYQLTNGGSGITYRTEAPDGSWINAAEVHLDEGEYTLKLSGLDVGGKPFLFTLYEGRMRDASEPNDLAYDALQIRVNEPFEVLMERGYPAEWLSLTPKTDGELLIRLDVKGRDCQSPFISYPDPANPQAMLSAPYTQSGVSRVFGPLAVTAETPQLMRITCANANSDSPLSGVALMKADMLAAASDDIPIYIIGLELDEAVSSSIIAAAGDSEVSFLEAEDSAILSERIEEVIEKETRESHIWKWLIALILLLVLGGICWKGRSETA